MSFSWDTVGNIGNSALPIAGAIAGGPAGLAGNAAGFLAGSAPGGGPQNFLPNIGNIGNDLGLNPKNNKFNAPIMDVDSKNQVAANENGLLRTPRDYPDLITQGTGAAENISNQGGAQAQETQSEGGGGMPGMQAAISNKAAKNFQTSQGRLQQQSQMQGMQMANQNMNTAAANAIALHDAQTGVNSAINQFNLQANAARYNTISSIMSGAGSIAGMAMAPGGHNNSMSQPMFNQQYGTNGSQNLSMPEMGSGIVPSPTTSSNGLGAYSFGE